MALFLDTSVLLHRQSHCRLNELDQVPRRRRPELVGFVNPDRSGLVVIELKKPGRPWLVGG
jgi:hypothetical protein